MSKIKLSFIIALTAILSLNSYSQGVEFYNGTWEEAVALAKKENKFLFIDAYTEWCGWCKVMDKSTFTDSTVGKFFKENIIAFKMDMEKGIGIKMAMKYRVNVFPSFLFFKPEGILASKLVGYREVDDFMSNCKKILFEKSLMNYPSDLNKLDLDYPEFYKKTFLTGKDRKWPEQEEVVKYLSSQDNLFSEVNWSVIFKFSLDEKYNMFFLDNISKYSEIYGETETQDKVSSIAYQYVQQAVKEQDETLLEKGTEIARKYSSEKNEISAVFYKIHYYKELKNWDKYTENVGQYIELDKFENTSSVNGFCWDIYLEVDNKDILNKAANWMKKVIEKDHQYAYIDTYAALLYKSGNLKEAEEFANKAIEVGKENNENVEGTEELLEKIRNK